MFKILFLLLSVVAASPQPDSFKEYRRMVDSAPFIVINKDSLTLTLCSESGEVLRHYGVSVAKKFGNKERRGDGRTPEGVFKINQVLKSDYLSHDFGDGKGPVKGAYGPWFLRLSTPGFIDIGIHGTHKPESIGTRDTEGCIRLRNEDILDLKQLVKVGTPVIILPDSK